MSEHPETASPPSTPDAPPAQPRVAFSLGVVLDADTIVVAGDADFEIPEAGELLFGAPGEERRGRLAAYSWRADPADAGAWHVLSVIAAPQVMGLQGLPIALVRGETAVAIPAIGRFELDLPPLIARLRRHGADVAAIFDFLHSRLAASADAPPSPRRGRFLQEFLDAIAEHDGFVEIVGRPEGGGLLLQGWSMHATAGLPALGIDGNGLAFFAAEVALFERPDLLATASGVVAFVKDAGAVEPTAVRHVFFAADGGYCRLDVVDQKIVLDGNDAVAHVKDMLGRLDGPPAVLRALKRVCRARFAGVETVSALAVPVRLGLDLVVAAEGAGILVNGWLLDPRRLVRRVLVKSTAGFCQRLDERWVRLARADVSAAFAADPLFAGHLRPGHHAHGFLALVAGATPPAAGEAHYLEIVLEDESCAFVPLRFSDGAPAELLHRILGLVSHDDPRLATIIAEHLGPVAGALAAADDAVPEPALIGRFGRPLARPRLSVLVPLLDGWRDFDATLARLALDADFRAAEIVVIGDGRLADQIAPRLRRYASFYDVCAALVAADGPLDAFRALELGAAVARAELLLFLSAAVVAPAGGWLARLARELQAHAQCAAVMPTLLYEDDSLRFAATPAASVAPAFHGYPRHWLASGAGGAVGCGTIECCLIRKAAFTAVGGFAPAFMAAELKTLDFGLRLRSAGFVQRWVPDVALYVADDGDAEGDEPWRGVRRLVDRWAFERRWGVASITPGAAAG